MENNILPDDIQKKVDEVAQRYESPAIFKEGVFYAFACAKIMAEKELSTLKAQKGGMWRQAVGGMREGLYSMKLVSNDVEMRGTGLVNHGVIQLITFLNKSTMGIDDLPKDYEGVYYLDESPNAYQELKDAKEAAVMFCNKHNTTATQLAETVDLAQALADALQGLLEWHNTALGYGLGRKIEAATEALNAWNGNGQKKEVEAADLGTCKECGTRKATTDYNGHHYNVCDPCCNRLNREFDNEYK